ncbi:hypothetical protein IGI04_025563, partial [Brassica rapa subsp. trilocularis]
MRELQVTNSFDASDVKINPSIPESDEYMKLFKLHILVKDNNNNTKMLLLDSEAQKVVGCMAKQIWDGSYNEMEDPELLPVEIAGAVGKTFHFGVQINKDNVSYGADTYKISKVWTLEELAKIEAEAAEADACETEEQESDEPVITMSSTKSSDKGVKIHATCKRPFFSRVQKLVVGQYIFIENFSLTAAAGNYRPTRHEYIILITSNTNVTNSLLQNDDNFLTLTTFPEIVNGNLDSKFLIDVIGHPIDIGNIQVVPVQGQVQITNAFEISSVEINPPGFILHDYIRLMPNDPTLTAAVPHVVKTIGNQRQPETWSLYPERTILEIIMSTKDETGELPVMLLDTIAEHILGVSAEVLLDGSLEEDSSVSIENAANTCFSSTPLSKRKVHNEIDDLSFTSKSRCSKIIK